ncbi:MAG: hypothetical protein ACI8X5_001507 [Planctomycetota bacterium]|jgi:hypothetical protein
MSTWQLNAKGTLWLVSAVAFAGCHSPTTPEPVDILVVEPAALEHVPEKPVKVVEAASTWQPNARRQELARKLAAEPGWNLYESPHYFIASNVDDPLLIGGAKNRLEAEYARLVEEFPPAVTSLGQERPLVRIYESHQAFTNAGGQKGTSGFWNAPQNTLVIYDGKNEKGRSQETWSALQHVVVHEYFDKVLGLDPVPAWLLYGVSAQFESLKYLPGISGPGALHFPAESDRWDHLATETAGTYPPPLSRFLRFSRGEFHGINEFGSGGYRNLILAWSFVHFLRDPLPDEKGSVEIEADREWRAGFLAHYVRALEGGNSQEEALQTALGAVELAALDAAWKAWIEAKIGRELGDG